ncbi:MAG: hypothetical protein K0U47_04710 [Epsilonproteobacteria bacterium]|nr:hypothetical protein [Campylobacterota bacterium]
MRRLFLAFLITSILTTAMFGGMSMTVFKRLQSIETLIADNHLDKAEKKLKEMLAEPPSKSEDKAYVFYTAGMFYLQKSQYAKAKKLFLSAYKLKALPEKTTLYLLQTLAGLSMQDEHFDEAIGYYQSYMAQASQPDKNVYLGLGTAYFYKKRYRDAVALLKQAVTLFEPKESLYLMLFASHYELKQLKSATHVLEKIVKFWPEKGKYWVQLSSLYIERNRYAKSLEVMQIAMTKGYLEKERDVMQYVYTLYEEALPMKAAIVLERAFDQGLVSKNRKNYELLSTMYQEAKERVKAIGALKLASSYASDGKNDLYIAQLYFEQENSFKQVIKHGKKAIQKGVKQKGNANMLIAVAYHELGEKEKAKAYLINASKYAKTQKAATQWLESFF